jgi:hypothetical protein
MSDINDLIASNARVAFDTGVKTERQRIVDIIEDYGSEDFTAELIAIIKGEQK